jgi:hypothetical protein
MSIVNHGVIVPSTLCFPSLLSLPCFAEHDRLVYLRDSDIVHGATNSSYRIEGLEIFFNLEDLEDAVNNFVG